MVHDHLTFYNIWGRVVTIFAQESIARYACLNFKFPILLNVIITFLIINSIYVVSEDLVRTLHTLKTGRGLIKVLQWRREQGRVPAGYNWFNWKSFLSYKVKINHYFLYAFYLRPQLSRDCCPDFIPFVS